MEIKDILYSAIQFLQSVSQGITNFLVQTAANSGLDVSTRFVSLVLALVFVGIIFLGFKMVKGVTGFFLKLIFILIGIFGVLAFVGFLIPW